MTPQLAYMFDAEVDFQSLETERLFVDFYTKLESSPQMDFYGLGGDSSLDNRSSYLYDDLAADFRIGEPPRDPWLTSHRPTPERCTRLRLTADPSALSVCVIMRLPKNGCFRCSSTHQCELLAIRLGSIVSSPIF